MNLVATALSPKLELPKDYVITLVEKTKPGYGPIRRVGTTPKPHATSMLESLQRTVKSKGTNNFLGHRPFDANGNAQSFVWQTYAQVYKRIENFAAGLVHDKMMELTADGERPLCLYMKNRPEWVIGQYASMYLGGFPVALYDTLRVDSVQFILNQTQSTTFLCTTAEFDNVLAAKEDVPTLKFVVLVNVETPSEADIASAEAVGLKLTTMTQIEAIGVEHETLPAMPKSTDIYCLIYTSGTTGNPKGVPLTHMNVLVKIEGALERLGVGDCVRTFTEEGIHLSYLPLAHCFEHTRWGSIGFYQGNTLKLLEDLVEIRPTIFLTVPRLLNKIYNKVMSAGRSSGGIKSWMFDCAVSIKLANLKQGYTKHPLFDGLIISQVQKKLGLDRCCMFVTGSAPVADDVMNFFRILFNFPIFEGYGQSETVAAGTITHIHDTQAVLGRGEVCFRGPPVFPGYYKDPKQTAEAFDEDGWLHSGDIGVWTLDGRLKLVDRKKNIFKLSQGEYIAPEKIENVLVTSPYVAQPFVYGDSLHSVLVTIVVPEEEPLRALAKSLNVHGTFD
ncbi:hypothetical protein AC1031_019377 [Aphanomyces cochlioides]|nr:hypothetical protein AC1031_019377 [Aphanomyces cochlioides]